MHQAWEQKDHVPAFVHDRAVTELAPNLARQFVLGSLLRGFEVLAHCKREKSHVTRLTVVPL